MKNLVVCKGEGVESAILQISDDLEKATSGYTLEVGALFLKQAALIASLLTDTLPLGVLDSLAELLMTDKEDRRLF
jgi:hypothetical protein